MNFQVAFDLLQVNISQQFLFYSIFPDNWHGISFHDPKETPNFIIGKE